MSDAAYDFEWDATKASSNLKKHGVSFERASTVFLDGLALTVYDDHHSHFEERWFTLGHTSEGELLAIAHTVVPISPAMTRIRIISARPATRQERRFYAEEPR
jgi:uncharacterized DUF497 family protein